MVIEEEKEDIEQEEESQCTQQNVMQCYNTYVTKYTDSIQEKCEEVFIKTCRIIMRSRAYNHTTRLCKRPLLKKCDTYEAPVRFAMNNMTTYHFLPRSLLMEGTVHHMLRHMDKICMLLMLRPLHKSLILCVEMSMRPCATLPHRSVREIHGHDHSLTIPNSDPSPRRISPARHHLCPRETKDLCRGLLSYCGG